MLVVYGDLDHWVTVNCPKFRAELPGGSPVEMQIYPGAGHMFDEGSRVSGGVYSYGTLVAYNSAAAAQSFALTKAFLYRYVASRSDQALLCHRNVGRVAHDHSRHCWKR